MKIALIMLLILLVPLAIFWVGYDKGWLAWDRDLPPATRAELEEHGATDANNFPNYILP